jgi:hypothetical protein
MNPILSYNLIRYNAARVLDFCTDSNMLYIKFEDTEKQINLASITNARIIKKQRSYLRLFLPAILCLLFSLVKAVILVKAVLSLFMVFVFIIQPRTSTKLLLNYRGGGFCEIPLQKKDMAIANKLVQSLANKSEIEQAL